MHHLCTHACEHAALHHLCMQIAAGTSAAAYTLTLAITTAFKRCDISGALRGPDLTVNANALLFDAAALNCTTALGVPKPGEIGYKLILDSLSNLQVGSVSLSWAQCACTWRCSAQPVLWQVLSGRGALGRHAVPHVQRGAPLGRGALT